MDVGAGGKVINLKESVMTIELAFAVVIIGLSTCLGKQVPALFVFGDSLVEAGNNNYIVGLSKANYLPYGIDFKAGPTGRFTNGRTIIDIIGQEIGLKDFIPPYLAPNTTGDVILKGVNYASGAGGIFNKSGFDFIGRINFDAQMTYFDYTKLEIISMVGEVAAAKLIKAAIFSVTFGSNDFLNNYLILYPGSPKTFVNGLISKLRYQLTRLYDLGARKIVVSNVGPIGCIPYERDTHPLSGDDCVAFQNNELARPFNSQLKSLLTELGKSLWGSMFLYADVFHVVDDIIANYASYGFESADTACCRNIVGRFGGLPPCSILSKICSDRSKYVFWDGYHPSDAACEIIANRLVYGDKNYISPINIQQLVNA